MATAMERDVYSPSLAIDKYKHGEDFDLWIERFQLAVGLAHNASGPDKIAKRNEHCLDWLPLMIDSATWTIYCSITSKDWDTIKKELSALLTDPQEKYDWFAGRNPIRWDGKESFHSLAMRIKLKVDKHIEETSRPRESFQQFRASLPKEYRKAIDLGCGEKWDVEEAKKIATRLRVAESNAAAEESEPTPLVGAAMAEGKTGDGISANSKRRFNDSSHGLDYRSRSNGRDLESNVRNKHPSRDCRRRDERYHAFDDRDESPEYERHDRDRQRDHGRRDHDRWEDRGHRDRDHRRDHGWYDRDRWENRGHYYDDECGDRGPHDRDRNQWREEEFHHDAGDRYARYRGDPSHRDASARRSEQQHNRPRDQGSNVNQLANELARYLRMNPGENGQKH